MHYIILLIFVAFAVATPTLVDDSGIRKTTYEPGEAIYLYLPEPGTLHVKIVDVSTGVVLLERTDTVARPGLYLIWALSSDTAEGTYKIYLLFNGQPYVYGFQIARRIPWQIYVVLAAAVATMVYLLWLYRDHLIPRLMATHVSYYLQLPNNHMVRINVPQATFGREFFLKIGVPPDVAKYISRSHFAIYIYRGRFYIQDLGSKNGTWLNGRPLKGTGPQPLRHGDIINVAQLLNLRFLAK